MGSIETIITDRVATIVFEHPASNSFPSTQLKALANAIEVLNNNKEVTVIVLKSTGSGAFCAGASFDELLSIQDFETGKEFFSGFARVINAMRSSKNIIVGRIQGKAVGGGVGLAAACDYTFATAKAMIKLSELAIGLGPFVIEPAVSRKIGKTAMASMSLAPNDWMSAQWAFDKGLYQKIFATADQMDEALNAYVSELSQYNPEALIEMKKVLWKDTDHWDTLLYENAGISGKLALSEFTVQALSKFKKK
ncbi:MAG: enoyl-CoA hydratase/isomerase family protein [Flavobacterium sp.]|nr:enoyl-CoA hydratase/isomerase family protein [Candidatus Neoflavobacterium equi]